jgi:hypothetical protein
MRDGGAGEDRLLTGSGRNHAYNWPRLLEAASCLTGRYMVI